MSRYRIHRDAAVPGQPDSHDWGHLNIFADHASMELEGVTIGRVRINRGRSNPLHIHDNCDEVIILLEGELEQMVGDESVHMKPGDVLVVPTGIPHRATSAGEVDADMVIVYNNGDRHYQLVD